MDAAEALAVLIEDRRHDLIADVLAAAMVLRPASSPGGLGPLVAATRRVREYMREREAIEAFKEGG